MIKRITISVFGLSILLLVSLILLPGSADTASAGENDQDLLTIQDSVQTRAQQYIDYYYDLGLPPSSDNVGVLSYSLAALIKNQNTESANELLIDMLSDASWDGMITGKPLTIYFDTPNLIRLWFMFNQNSTMYPGRLTTEAEDAIKQWFFDHAYVRSKYANASLDQLWTIDGSENHDMIRRTSAYFMTLALKDDPDFKDLPLQDGYTIAEHAEAWENYYKHWFQERARKGTLIEIGSTIYFKYTISSIYNIRDFASDALTRHHADQFLTMLFADYAQEYSNGVRGGAKARVYRDDKYSFYGRMDSIHGYSQLYYNLGSVQNIPFSGGDYTLWPAVTSSYRVPLIVMDVALYPESKGNYTYTSTRPARDPHTLYNVEFPSDLRRYSYVTPAYINGVFTIDTSQGSYNNGQYLLMNEQNRWMGVMFTGRKDTRTFFSTLSTDPDPKTSYSDVNGIADGNAMILQKPSIATRSGQARIFFSYDLYEARTESDGWIFTYDPNGSGYLGVKPGSGTIASWTDVIWNRNPIGTFVTNGALNNTNYSASTQLRVKNSTTDGSIAYLRIDHPGDVQVGESKLRLYANGRSGNPVVKLYGLTGDSWNPNSITWNAGSTNHSSSGYSVTGEGVTSTYITSETIGSDLIYYEFDVTDFVNSQIASDTWHKGDATLSFMLVADNADGSYVTFNSSQATNNKPQLVSLTGKYANLSDQYAPVVFQTGMAGDYTDFAAFQADVIDNVFRWNSSTEFEYQGTGSANLKFYTTSALPKINNVTVDLNPTKTYDSPYISAGYDSPIITLTNTSDESMTLDFSITSGKWMLDESNGMVAIDSSGNGNDGTVNGAARTTGYFGNALMFDGVDDYVELPTGAGIHTTEGSVSFWMKTNQTATSMLFYGSPVTSGDGLGGADEFHIHMGPTGKLALFIRGTTNDVDLVSSESYNDGQWHHVAATWNANGKAVLYVNGSQVASQEHDANLFELSAVLRLGRPGQATRHYAGLLDQVQVHRVALSADQVQEIANQLPEAAGSWNMDEANGTVLIDSSGNGNDGTASGAVRTTGYLGKALSFDGVDDYAELPTGTGMNTAKGSVSFWMKTNHNATAMLFYGSPVTSGDGLGSGNEFHVHMGPSGKLALFIRGSATDVDITSSGSYNDGQWHHVAATWDVNGNAVLYVDGSPVGTQVHDGNVFDLSAIVRLGRPGQATRYYAGLLDRVNIYDVSLTAAQVQVLAAE